MTVSEAFPIIIAKYEKCISEIELMYSIDNIWNSVRRNFCILGICNCFHEIFGYTNCEKISKVLELKHTLDFLCEVPRYNRAKQDNIDILKFRINAMKIAIEKYPNEIL